MVIEILVGLNITDNELYNLYRKEITPILNRYGGGFGYDFKIFEVLKFGSEVPINQVFTIFFPDEDSKNSLFSNEKYLKSYLTPEDFLLGRKHERLT